MQNGWQGRQSLSGPGSDPEQTATLVRRLPLIFRKFNISTILDIPCGDFYWMQHVDLKGIEYTGADIVPALVRKNLKLHSKPQVAFRRLDLTADSLPRVDLVLVRDCLVHLTYRDALSALGNICRSGSTYLMTTTFPERQENHDIATGDWRALNLERAPFELPSPLLLINEGCTENDGAYADKSLGLWSISDIQTKEHGRQQ